MREHIWHAKKVREVLDHWGVDPQQGLDSETARTRLAEWGPNLLQAKAKASPLEQFVRQFTDFIVLVLIGAALLSGPLLGEWTDAIAILAIVFLNATLGFIQEYRAERALEALKELTAPMATVLRQGETTTIPAKEVVPGDIILLETGSLVPADARLIEAHNLRTNESSLTGESTPVEKVAEETLDEQTPLGDRRNMVHSSTVVVYGKGRAVVTATGMNTELGKIAGMLQEIGEEQTPLQQELDRVGKLLVYGCLAIVAAVFGLGLIHQEPPLEMFLVAISLAVAAIPEGLPAVVTIALALGVQRMVKRNALVRRLPSVETLGAATVICADKTGTLTENKMTVRQVVTANHNIYVTGEGYMPEGRFEVDSGPLSVDHCDLQLVLKIGALCNNAELKAPSSGGDWTVRGDPTEAALLVSAAKAHISLSALEHDYPFVEEIPFDARRKRMTIVRAVSDDQNAPPDVNCQALSKGRRVAFVKGAPDLVLELCTHIYVDGKVERLSDRKRQQLLETNSQLAGQALRLLAMAYRPLDSDGPYTAENIERDLIFAGMQAMIDPPRSEAKAAVDKCKRAGIEVVMITGDHRNTAVAIARELGLYKEGDLALTGADLDKIGDSELEQIIERVRVYARVSPEHKLRIVRAWKARGHIVAMTGDGVNDAPALKESDIGIAMGITGTDVSKESSDMILADDNFASIVAAIEEGRAIFDNIRRFIHYLLSCNIGEVMTLFVSSLIPGFPLPLLPIQILWINLATDSVPALALGVEPAEPGIMERPPRPARETIITRGIASVMGFQGLLIGLLTLGAFAIEYYLVGGGVERARVMAFSATIFAQNLHAFNCRSQRHSLLRLGLFSNPWLVVAFLLVVISEMAIIYLPFFQPVFATMPLSFQDWGIVIGLGSMPLIVMEAVKSLRAWREERR